jgi:hypothetical protein
MFGGLPLPCSLLEIMETWRGVNKEFAIISVKSLLDLESMPAMPAIQICIAPLLLNFARTMSNFKMAGPFQKEAWLEQQKQQGR